jgi:hypothetical protein
LHDCELAAAIGCDCLLFARGHQARERLARGIDGAGAASGTTRLIESLSEVTEYVDARGESH